MDVTLIRSKGDDAAPDAVRAGNLVLVGGLLGVDAHGALVGPDIESQARAIFARLGRILAEAGSSWADVVKNNIYFVCDDDDAEIARIVAVLDEIRRDYFNDPWPVTTEIRCGLEREGALIAVDAWAVVGGEREILAPPGHWRWHGRPPYSQGIKVGNLVFVGGQRALDQDGQLVGIGDIEVQTDIAFRGLDTMLVAAGGSRNNLMRQNTFFRFFGQGRDVTDFWEKMTAVRRRYMSKPSAAGAGLRLKGLAKVDELIQVEGIAVLGDDKLRLQPADHWDWSIEGNDFTQGWLIDGLGFIGGQISADSNAKAVGATLEEQTRNVFHFIRRTLGEGDLTEADVIKLYIYYHAEGDWASVEEARRTIARVQAEFYPGAGPAVTAIRVAGFAFEDLLIEIEAFAVK
jgi:enamine deaminase RidA (YjgF/YER057c/UK114 family)